MRLLVVLTAILVGVSGLFTISSSALADDGYAGGVGQTPVPRNSKDIVMQSEVVNIVLHEGFAEVECAYRFHNEGGAQEVMMGFPNPIDPYSHSELHDLGISIFRVFENDKEVPFRTTTITLKPDHPDSGYFGEKSIWYLHNVSFAKDETKVVVNRYIAPHGRTASLQTASVEHFTYILRTGSTWKGTIGRADINVSFASSLSWSNFVRDPEFYTEFYKEYGEVLKPDPKGDIMINPDGYIKKVNGFSWTFMDFEPKDPQSETSRIHFGFYRNLNKTGPTTRKATATSWLDAGNNKYPPIQAFDDDVNSAWAEGAKGSGIGENIMVTFKSTRKIAEVRILPGYTKANKLFYKYSRPKKVTLEFSDGTDMQVDLADDPSVQYFALKYPISADWAQLTIDDVYGGDVGADTYVSEIEFGPSITKRPVNATELLNRMSGFNSQEHGAASTIIPATDKQAISKTATSKPIAAKPKSPSTALQPLTVILILVAGLIIGFLAGVLIKKRTTKIRQ